MPQLDVRVDRQQIERRALERQIRINAQALPRASIGDIAKLAQAAIDSPSLPLSILGVTLALPVTRGTFNVMFMIGISMLMGLVTRKSILLIDFVNQRRAAGEAPLDAILESGRIRLRPSIMNAIAMIFGMLPLALGLGEGGEQWAPMARAVIGGLITSALLTLIVVPVAYTLIDDAAEWMARRRRAAVPARRHEPAQALADADSPTPA